MADPLLALSEATGRISAILARDPAQSNRQGDLLDAFLELAPSDREVFAAALIGQLVSGEDLRARMQRVAA